MNEHPFVNEVFTNSVNLYLKYKGKNDSIFQSFLVVVIRTLINLYGELDIINPFITQNEHNMGGLDGNITKYGFPASSLADFKNQFISFQKEEKNGNVPNISFLNIEKYLMDMYFYKMGSSTLTEEEKGSFLSYMYFPDNPNLNIQNDMNRYMTDKTLLIRYFKSREYEVIHPFILEPVHRFTLMPEAYMLLGYNMGSVNAFSEQDLQNVNNQIYKFFGVDSTSSNKTELLGKAINYYKRYGNRITSGNGFVDLLLLASIISTAIFICVLFAMHYF